MIKSNKEIKCLNCGLLISPFSILGKEGLGILNEDRCEVRYKAGEIVFKKGSPLTHIACLTSGMLKVFLEGSVNKNIVLSLISPKEIVGWTGFEVDYKHHFSVSAIEESDVCLISIQKFKELLKMDQDFSLKVVGYLNTKNIRSYEKLFNLTHKQMHGRVADTLLYLSEDIYKAERFKTRLSRQDLADCSALTKESTIRILKEFNNEGIIHHKGNEFEILNKKALLRISQSG